MWRIHLENLIRFGHMGYRMYVMRENPDGSGAVLLPPTFRTIERYNALSTEDCFLDDGRMPDSNVKAFLQAASDAAWEIGIKPKQIEGSSNELKATKYHLEDMRQLTGVKK